MKDEEKALQLSGLKETPDEEERYYNPFNCKIYDKCLEMAKYKNEQINLLFDAIDYVYLQTDGTYGDLALPVVDKINYLKSLKTTKS